MSEKIRLDNFNIYCKGCDTITILNDNNLCDVCVNIIPKYIPEEQCGKYIEKWWRNIQNAS